VTEPGRARDVAVELRRGSATVDRWRTGVRSAALDLLGPRPGVTPLERGWAAPVVLLWAVGRVVNLSLLGIAYVVSRVGGWGFGPDGEQATTFLKFLSGWDADRYATIAGEGYPIALPVGLDGRVDLNNWAFLPVFPFLERLLAQMSGMPVQLAGVLISLGASCAATLVLYALLRHVAAPRASWWAVVLFSLGPLSFVFVLGYAESLFLFLIFTTLLLAIQRRYLLIAPFGVAAAFTRPGALALALALGILLIGRLVVRDQDPISRSEATGLVVAGLSTAAAGLLWPVIADAVTGETGAYVQTEMAWWVPYIGDGHIIPLAPGLVMGWTWLGPVGVVLVIALVAAVFRWVLSRPVRALGLEVVSFALSYTLYLFAVFLPTQSVLRLLLPLAPLLADSRLSETRRRRVWSVVICIALQVVAVFLLWTIGNP
jgi:hypothetical protein